ncbi:MAG: maleylpyruvate isomerase N-terminal domain-containing protein [Geodermatophilaceae bacterium]|nr:maleylpyruvate isomerase N-terminal domain-containing protein [Geodermatophilaceae bacterium]
MPNLERTPEAEAFLEAREHTAPDVVSACEGWTAHEVTAHLAAAAAEISRHLEPYLQGDAVPKTRTFEERELRWRGMDEVTLCRGLADEEAKLRILIQQVLEQDPDAVIPWTGRQMAVAAFLPHMRSEFAIHRWDFVGDDEVSIALLSQPELTEHAIRVLGHLLLVRGADHDRSPGEDLHVRLRAEHGPDVRLVVEGGQARLELATGPSDEPHVDLDAAARTLVIWGRRPDRRGRFHSHVGEPTLHRLQALLSGY